MLKASKLLPTPLWMLLSAAFAAVVVWKAPKAALALGLFLLAYGLWKTLRTRNRDGAAHLYAGLIVGAEVFFRMSFAGLPWEFGKIAVFLLLLTGLIVERLRKPFSLIFLFYFLMLLPGVFVPDWPNMEAFKKEFMFTFFGEVVLVVSVFYFFRRPMTMEQITRLGRWIVTGVFMSSVLLFLKTPDYAAIHYGGGSNFVASGGFGPNQVSAILGLGMVLTGAFVLLNKRLFISRWIDLGLLGLFTMQGFFTLSRGGLMSAGLALFVAVSVVYRSSPSRAVKLLHLSLWKFLLLGLLILGISYQVDQVTQGALAKRYLNVDQYGQVVKEDYTTKRGDIVKDDWKTFLRFPITGAGIGGGRIYRAQNTGISAAHVELSRLPAEHGILGLLALLILLFYPVFTFFRIGNLQSRFFLALFIAYGVLTMSHNAIRLAMPSFIYGLGYVMIYLESKIRKGEK